MEKMILEYIDKEIFLLNGRNTKRKLPHQPIESQLSLN